MSHSLHILSIKELELQVIAVNSSSSELLLLSLCPEEEQGLKLKALVHYQTQLCNLISCYGSGLMKLCKVFDILPIHVTK